MSSPSSPQPFETTPLPEASRSGPLPETHQARVRAEQAIAQFQSKVVAMTDEEAKEAYAHLMVGRGFEKVRPNAPETPPDSPAVEPDREPLPEPSRAEARAESPARGVSMSQSLRRIFLEILARRKP